MVPLSSLPLAFYPFISFSIPHALLYSTPVGKPFPAYITFFPLGFSQMETLSLCVFSEQTNYDG